MLDNTYYDELVSDPRLFDAVESALPKIELLSKGQIEVLVFYLKSLHSRYPSEYVDLRSRTDAFQETLSKLRNSDEQGILERRSSRLLLLCMVICMVSGVVVAFGAGHLVASGSGLGWSFVVAGLVLLAVAWKCGIKSIEVSKEQDRRHFLNSVRSARDCNELDLAGLFSYHDVDVSGPYSDAKLRLIDHRVSQLCCQLRDALYNDVEGRFKDPLK